MKFKPCQKIVCLVCLLLLVLITSPLPKPVLAVLQPFHLLLGVYPENLLMPFSSGIDGQGSNQIKGFISLANNPLKVILALRGQGERASAHTRRSRRPNVPVTR